MNTSSITSVPQGTILSFSAPNKKNKLKLEIKNSAGVVFEFLVKEDQGKILSSKKQRKWVPLQAIDQNGKPQKLLANVHVLGIRLNLKGHVIRNPQAFGSPTLEQMIQEKINLSETEREIGLTVEQLIGANKTLNVNKDEWQKKACASSDPYIILKPSETGLPCKVIVTKNGAAYLVLKTTGIRKIARGTFKVVTKLLKHEDLEKILNRHIPFTKEILYALSTSKFVDRNGIYQASFEENAKREVEILEALNGYPEILQLAEKAHYYEGKDGIRRQALITKYYPEGNFGKKIDNGFFSKYAELRSILLSYLKGVAVLHQKGFLNKDLKLENILVVKDVDPSTNKDIWSGILADFGLACSIKDGVTIIKPTGTLLYFAPEKIEQSLYGWSTYPITFASDIWAIGLIFHEVFSYLFNDQSFPAMLTPLFKYASEVQDTGSGNPDLLIETLELIKDPNSFPEPVGTTLADQLRHLVWEMFRYIPDDRITAPSIIAKLTLI